MFFIKKQQITGLTPLNIRYREFCYEDVGAMLLDKDEILGRSPQIFVAKNETEQQKGLSTEIVIAKNAIVQQKGHSPEIFVAKKYNRTTKGT